MAKIVPVGDSHACCALEAPWPWASLGEAFSGSFLLSVAQCAWCLMTASHSGGACRPPSNVLGTGDRSTGLPSRGHLAMAASALCSAVFEGSQCSTLTGVKDTLQVLREPRLRGQCHLLHWRLSWKWDSSGKRLWPLSISIMPPCSILKAQMHGISTVLKL